MQIDDMMRDVIGLAMRVHTELGPGLFESVYETVLAGKLVEMGYTVGRQRLVDIEFEGTRFPNAFKVDLIIKSVEKLSPLYRKQLLTYLRLMHLSVGLIPNFGGLTLKGGIDRVVNGHVHQASSAISAPSA